MVVHQEGRKNMLAKVMELSEVGTLAYLLEDEEVTNSVELSLCHQGNIFRIPATVVQKNGRLTGFEFASPSLENFREIQSKLIRMEVEWMRLNRRR